MWLSVLVLVLNYSLSAIFPLLSVKMLTTAFLKYHETVGETFAFAQYMHNTIQYSHSTSIISQLTRVTYFTVT